MTLRTWHLSHCCPGQHKTIVRHIGVNFDGGTFFFKITLNTPVLSHDQDLKKDTNKRSMYSEPLRPTDTGKYCQNLKTWGETDFLPKKWVKKT